MKGKFSTYTGAAAYTIANHGFVEGQITVADESWTYVTFNATSLLNVGENELHQQFLAERASELGTTVDDPSVHLPVLIIFHEDSQGFVDIESFDTVHDADHYWSTLESLLGGA